MIKLFKYLYPLFILIFPMQHLYAASLIIGTLAFSPPFEVQSSNGEFFGFEIRLMQEICARIKYQCVFKAVDFQDIAPMIDTGALDVGIASIIITPEKQKEYLFSIPYKSSDLQYLIKADSNFKTWQELHGKAIGTYNDSQAFIFVKKQFNNNVQVKTYRHTIDIIDALNKQAVSAIVISAGQAMYWAANSNTAFKLLGERYLVGEGYGIVAKLGRDDIMNQINTALLAMEADGTYLKIYQLSFGS